MTVATYALGRPRPAASRGGDCRARDLDQGRNVHGPHRFAATTDCQISNGMLRLTVGATGAAPSLTVEAWRGRLAIADYYTDVYHDLYQGDIAVPSWLAMGTLTIDSPTVAALLTAVQIVQVSPEVIILRLVAPVIHDAYVVLRRGWRTASIMHGNTRGATVDTERRIRWIASPSPIGTASLGRVDETTSPAGFDGFRRVIGCVDPVTANAGAFSLTATSVTSARFGAGVGTQKPRDRTVDQHRQLGDNSRPVLVVT